MTNWSNFSNINAQELNAQVKGLAKGDFEELPLGRYEVSVEGLELKPTKEKGFPMVAAKFKVVQGEHTGLLIFMNQVVIRGDQHDAMRLGIANRFLDSLKTGVEITFEGVQEYAYLIDEVFNNIGRKEYLLEIGEKNGFRNYKIIEVYA